MIKAKHIRDKTVELLQSHPRAKVFNSQVTNIQQDELPVICVYVKAENAEGREPNSAGFYITYELTIDILVKADRTLSFDETNWQNTVDELEDFVTETLFTDETWVQLTDSIQGYTVEREITDEGEYEMALTTMTIVRDAYYSYQL